MKNMIELKNTLAAILLASLFSACGPLCAFLYAQESDGALSRPAEHAIRLYHNGQDTEAMDRFIDILVNGTPAEKALANEYISKITLRMNTGVNPEKDKGTGHDTLNDVEQKRADAKAPAAPLREKEPVAQGTDGSQAGETQEQRDHVNEKITLQIARMRRDLLLELGNSESVKLYMGDSLPKAITLDPEQLFSGEVSFRAGTDKLLGTLSGLIFTLGGANCLILPEGTGEGEVKIKGIRRALALNSYFESRGISKARLDVNLTGTEVRFPKELTNLKGIIILFDYNKEPRLKDLEDLQTKGPKVSLGVYPTAISVQNNEGAVVEFSAFESPVGKPSWKFQVFQVQKDGARLQLQEVSGSGAQHSQSFWNGRRKFFGAPYPSGKYMFTITATDLEGKETTLSRLLVVRPSPEETRALEERPAAPAKAPAPAVSAATKAGVKTSRGLKGKPLGKVLMGASARKAKAAAKKPRKPVKPARKKKSAGADAGGAPAGSSAEPPAEAGEFSGQVSYKIYFKENTSSITANSEKKLAQVAETLNYYPMANIMMTGYAYTGEANADAMAESRVNYVAARLAEKYKIDRARMEVQSKVSEVPKSIVEIKMTGKE